MATATRTRTTRKSASAKPAAAKPTRTRRAPVKDETAEMVAEFVAAITDGSLDGHLATLDAALTERTNSANAAKRTRSTTRAASKSASAKPAARKTAAAGVKLTLDSLEPGTNYKVKDGTKSAKGVDISGQRVTFEKVAKKNGEPVARVNLNGKAILLPATALTVAGRGRPPKPVEL